MSQYIDLLNNERRVVLRNLRREFSNKHMMEKRCTNLLQINRDREKQILGTQIEIESDD